MNRNWTGAYLLQLSTFACKVSKSILVYFEKIKAKRIKEDV